MSKTYPDSVSMSSVQQTSLGFLFTGDLEGLAGQGLFFLPPHIRGSAMIVVSQRSQETFDLVSEGAGVGRSQSVALNGSGTSSLWIAEGFSRVKPQTSASTSSPLYGASG